MLIGILLVNLFMVVVLVMIYFLVDDMRQKM